jgi:hypothetical protein
MGVGHFARQGRPIKTSDENESGDAN